MDHNDHINLIRNAIGKNDKLWADFGSGGGAFTLALRDIAGPDVEIYSVDKNLIRLKDQEKAFRHYYPDSHIRYIHGDFTNISGLPTLDGIIMANSLHFIPYQEQQTFLTHCKQLLKPKGKIIIVEYDTDKGNIWVPYPRASRTMQLLLQNAGYAYVHKVGEISSGFLDKIYALIAFGV